ncbi:MAG: hypothetical protein AMXMBFR46_08480 [Acidimicrobiia bacterium]
MASTGGTPEGRTAETGTDASELEARRAALERAVDEWSSQLVDLGGRNTLLYFRDLRVGSLDLGDAEPAALGELLDGRPVSLSRLYAEPEARAAMAKRCRAVRAKARENHEERGLLTLFLGVGMATWTNHRGTAVPNAPVLLRPVSLTPRGGAEEDFDFAPIDDWDLNPTLVHVVRNEFSVEVDPEQVVDAAFDESGPLDPTTVFDRLTKLADAVPGFGVIRRVIVANLSYAKLPMVQDLQGSFDALAGHPVICALAGSEADRRRLRDAQAVSGEGIDEALPDRTEPGAEFMVLDADASQHRVVNLALAGTNLVVQGPPGTGKSQTISNLIAALVAHGRSVLFVAEKRAAIDAVTKRLQGVGLGDLVLDLHDGASSRKKLADDLGRALDAMGQVPATDYSAVQRTLVARRAALNGYSAALRERRPPWDVSVFELQAELIGVPPASRTDVRLFGPALDALDGAAYPVAVDELSEWLDLGGPAIEACASPWAAAAPRVRTTDDALRLQELVATTRTSTLPICRAEVDGVARAVGLRAPQTVDAAIEVVAVLRGVEGALEQLRPDVFDADLPRLIADLEPAARGGLSAAMATLFRRRYRAARRAARELRRREGGSAKDLRRALVDAEGLRTRWAALTADGGRPRGAPGVDASARAVEQVQAALVDLGAWLGTGPGTDRSFEQVGVDLGALVDDAVTLQRLPRVAELRASLDARGLGPFRAEAAQRGLDAPGARAALAWLRGRSILDTVATVDPRIGAFDGAQHTAIVREFIDIDRDQIASGAERVKRAAAEAALAARNAHPDQEDVLQKNARMKRRHASIRDLMARAPDVLLALRPCWVMSPLVVAQLLPSGRPLFDVVVFDEASQIRPADAISSLARARQTVVSGDSKQLPPTRFFDVTTTEKDEEAEGAEAAGASFTEDMDSILDALSALLPPPHGSQTLSWHYRSRDERLIAFSNAQPELYDWSLTTFPGTVGTDVLRHVLVPHRPGVGGTIDSSTDEVAAVVELIREHARTRPEESLGVIALGITHADRIRETLRLARGDDPELDMAPCLDELRLEDPFFVKNLERVQGDERDAIILSIGYPKTTDGRMQYRFGPLNQEGGERRLNVAITRARRRIVVTSSFTPEDMDPDRLTAEGARMLKRYLAYARSGGTELGPHAMPKPALNPFEQDVMARLTSAGIPLVAQYGVAGYWIDFAAKHPAEPGRMVLAIEADGASYHSSPVARVRDRLREQHLERLGWTFHRIWSTAWFRDPEGEVAEAREAYERAVALAGAGPPPQPGPTTGITASPPAPSPGPSGGSPVASPGPSGGSPVASPGPSGASVPTRGSRPAVPRGRPIDDYEPRQLDALCRWIQSDTLLRTDDELLEAMMHELGFQRRGKRIVDAISASIARVRPT